MYPTRSFFILLAFMLSFLGQGVLGQVIGVPSLGFAEVGIACANDQSLNQFQVSATAVGTFGADNKFILQLSDHLGNFDAPLDLASIASGGGSINFSFDFPEVEHGILYRVRVASTSPTIVSAPSQNFELSTLYNVELESDADVICAGEEVTLTYKGNHQNVVWLKDNAVIPGATENTLKVRDAGTYRVQVDGGSCTAASNQVVLALETLPSASFESDLGNTPCLGESLHLNADVRIASHTYRWFKDGEEIKGLFQPAYTLPINELTFDDSGVYSLEVSNAAGCSETSSDFELNVQGIAYTINDISERIVSAEVSTELRIEVQQGNVSIQWERDGVLLPDADEMQLNASQGGVYRARLQSQEGCEILTEEIRVTEITGLSLLIDYKSDYTPCMAGAVGLELLELKGIDAEGYFVDLPKSVANQLEIAWFHQDNNLGVGMSSITLGAASKDGVYYLRGTLLGIVDVSNQLRVERVPKALIASNGGHTLCPDASLTLSVEHRAGQTYQWYKDGEVLGTSLEAQLETSEAGSYVIEVTNGSCSAISDAFVLEALDDAGVSILPRVATIELPHGESQVLQAAGAENYRWYNDRGDLLAIDQDLELTEGGTYYLEAFIGACSVIRSIEIVALPSYLETIPNVITPNGDGKNDLWQLPGDLSFSDEVRVLLIDQAGNRIIDTYNYQNDWDGTTNGFPGSLFYFVIYRNDVELAKGGLHVLR